MASDLPHRDRRRLGGGAARPAAYTTSTRGRTLAEEGFIHASRPEQVQPVLDRWYADVAEPLVLLVVDPDRLTAEVRVEPVGDDTYPHVFGPIDPAAVVAVHPIDAQHRWDQSRDQR